MTRYFAESVKGGKGFPTAHFVYDRAASPPRAIAMRTTKAKATAMAKHWSETALPWVVPTPRGHAAELDRLRTWADRPRAVAA